MMKASIQLTGLQLARGYGLGSPYTQAMVDTTRALLDGGGSGEQERIPDMDVSRYSFAGPPELVRPVIVAFMDFIHMVDEDRHTPLSH